MEDVVPDAESLLHHPLNLSGDEVVEEKQNPEAASSGFINHLISNLVAGEDADEKNQDKQAEKEKTEEEEDGGGGGGGGGGLINNIVSSLFHHSEGHEGRESSEGIKKEEMVKVSAKNRAEKTEGGGIIDTIVSHLPSSLPDDAAPTTDEATILIHIVQD